MVVANLNRVCHKKTLVCHRFSSSLPQAKAHSYVFLMVFVANLLVAFSIIIKYFLKNRIERMKK
jgi:hypothetical protein